MSQNAFNRLANNVSIYMIGNVSSKLMQMLILPLLTAWVPAASFGLYDLVLTGINLLIPLLTFQILEALFRFFFDADEDNRKQILSGSFVILFAGTIFGIIVGLFINIFIFNIPFFLIICFNYIATICMFAFQKCARSLQFNRVFAFSGVLYTFVMLFFQLIFIGVFHMKVEGLLLANGMAFFLGAIYIFIAIKIWRYFSFKNVSYELLIPMLKYSIPLIPNSICWWGLASINTYIISLKLGIASLGIYAIANRFPQLLSFVTSVFQLSWEENAIIESDSKERNLFYSKTFELYVRLLFGGYIVLLPFVKLIFPVLVSKPYGSGIGYIPLLFLGTIFAAMSQYYGSAYVVSKKTKGAIHTTLVAALVNILFTWFLVDDIGCYAAAIGTMLAFFVQWVYRAIQVREFFVIELNYVLFISMFIWIFFIMGAFYILPYSHQWIVLIGSLCISAYYNRKILNKLLSKVHRYSR